MVNEYLCAAYAAAWFIFILYAWNLTRRQSRLRAELEDLKRKIVSPDGGPPDTFNV